jgi:hypothetical protein
MFYSKPYVAAKISNGGYFAQGGRPSIVYPGENTTYTFQNGTTVTHTNVALLRLDFVGATDNGYFSARAAGSGSSLQTPVAFPHDSAGYPVPVVSSNDSTIAGYYLTGDKLQDVAVLSVLSFEPASVVEFQAVAQTFFANAKRDGKTKLIIDLSANNGGYILSGYDLFRQLFPQTEQVGYTRYRENAILSSLVNASKKLFPSNYNPKNATGNQITAYEQSWNYLYDLNITGQHFPSVESKFGPHPYKGSNFSALQSWDLNDPLTTVDSQYGFGAEITGYGSRKNFTQPFSAENIILVSSIYGSRIQDFPKLSIIISFTMGSVPRPVLYLATSCATKAASNRSLWGVGRRPNLCKELVELGAGWVQPGLISPGLFTNTVVS